MSDGFGETTILKDPPAPAADADLSTRIEQTVQREPLDKVKCVRVFGNYYRCNWWAPPVGAKAGEHTSAWGDVATQHVRKSRFLSVTLVEGQLVIKDPPIRAL